MTAPTSTAPGPEKESVRARLFREQTVTCNGVVIEVRPLDFHKIPELIKSIKALWPVFTGEGLDIENVMADVVNLLRPCVTVPEDPALTVEDLPAGLIPDILSIFIEQSLHVGKWIGLAGKVRLTVEADESSD